MSPARRPAPTRRLLLLVPCAALFVSLLAVHPAGAQDYDPPLTPRLPREEPYWRQSDEEFERWMREFEEELRQLLPYHGYPICPDLNLA